ncbi:MAG: hypothetical protein KGR26_15085 [Cyanobacteria bacterium REEB65]|nr:hypothetical protein [Cyanobacteria bacterium REEB65]
MSSTLLQALVDQATADSRAFQVRVGGVRVVLGPNPGGGFVLEIRRSAGRVNEREAVDIAVAVHRLLERKGVPLGPEMLAYESCDRAKCFVLASPEAVSA